MPLPNPLASKSGRLLAFFALYVTEGIPLGFAATAVATQLRRQGVGPAAVWAFVASFYLPWAFKWAFGPFVDVFASERLGRRRGWILAMQVLMAITLLSTALVPLPEQLWLFTIVLLLHNTFGAVQDVAIDALACNTLQESERGLANGVMFAGAYIGSMLGGSGVLFLTKFTGFQPTFIVVSAAILVVTALVVVPMKEPRREATNPATGQRFRAAGRELHTFAVAAFRSFLGSRGAFAGLLFALLPTGALCLGLALQSSLAVELGLDDDQVAWLNLASAITSAAACVAGGLLSDRFGRRWSLFTFVALLGFPVLVFAALLHQQGWIMPVAADAVARPVVPAILVTGLWVATLVYSALHGLMYGTRAAIFMDVTNPAVAATQFTAYMALLNVTIAYSATWQGIAIEAWGYPLTMALDAGLGVVCLGLIPFLRKPPRSGERFLDGQSPLRARGLSLGLALACWAWIPYRVWQDALGAAQPIAGTVFTLVFVGSAVFLLAGGAVLGRTSPVLARLGAWFAPLLLLMHARHYAADIASWFGLAECMRYADAAFLAIPAAGGAFLLALATRTWHELVPVASGGQTAIPE